jgi:hypothetical protein
VSEYFTELIPITSPAGLTAEYLDLNLKLTQAEMALQESFDNIKKIKDEKGN